MAERRMFAKTIIDSDAFLDMPLSTQALYFHLSMRADDDGFINNPKKIQRMIGCGEDDLKLLLVKNFIIPFESGVCVIKHWKIHNYIRNDRYKPTVYAEEKAQLTCKENGAYTLGIPDGYQTETQVRLGKDRLGEVREEIPTSGEVALPAPPKQTKKTPAKSKHGEYQNVLLTESEFEKLAKDFGADLRDKAISFLDAYIEEKGYKSKSHNLAIRRWVLDAVKENEAKPKYGKRKEPVPGWANKPRQTDEEELAAINRLLADEDLQERAEDLRQRLQGG